MTTTQLQSTIKFWEKSGHFNLDLYQKCLENKPYTNGLNEELTEGKHLTANIAYILMFILGGIFLLVGKLIS